MRTAQTTGQQLMQNGGYPRETGHTTNLEGAIERIREDLVALRYFLLYALQMNCSSNLLSDHDCRCACRELDCHCRMNSDMITQIKLQLVKRLNLMLLLLTTTQIRAKTTKSNKRRNGDEHKITFTSNSFQISSSRSLSTNKFRVSRSQDQLGNIVYRVNNSESRGGKNVEGDVMVFGRDVGCETSKINDPPCLLCECKRKSYFSARSYMPVFSISF